MENNRNERLELLNLIGFDDCSENAYRERSDEAIEELESMQRMRSSRNDGYSMGLTYSGDFDDGEFPRDKYPYVTGRKVSALTGFSHGWDDRRSFEIFEPRGYWKEAYQREMEEFRAFMKYAAGDMPEEQYYVGEWKYHDYNHEVTNPSTFYQIGHRDDHTLLQERLREIQECGDDSAIFELCPEFFSRRGAHAGCVRKRRSEMQASQIISEGITFDVLIDAKGTQRDQDGRFTSPREEYDNQWEMPWQDTMSHPMLQNLFCSRKPTFRYAHATSDKEMEISFLKHVDKCQGQWLCEHALDEMVVAEKGEGLMWYDVKGNHSQAVVDWSHPHIAPRLSLRERVIEELESLRDDNNMWGNVWYNELRRVEYQDVEGEAFQAALLFAECRVGKHPECDEENAPQKRKPKNFVYSFGSREGGGTSIRTGLEVQPGDNEMIYEANYEAERLRREKICNELYPDVTEEEWERDGCKCGRIPSCGCYEPERFHELVTGEGARNTFHMFHMVPRYVPEVVRGELDLACAEAHSRVHMQYGVMSHSFTAWRKEFHSMVDDVRMFIAMDVPDVFGKNPVYFTGILERPFEGDWLGPAEGLGEHEIFQEVFGVEPQTGHVRARARRGVPGTSYDLLIKPDRLGIRKVHRSENEVAWTLVSHVPKRGRDFRSPGWQMVDQLASSRTTPISNHGNFDDYRRFNTRYGHDPRFGLACPGLDGHIASVNRPVWPLVMPALSIVHGGGRFTNYTHPVARPQWIHHSNEIAIDRCNKRRRKVSSLKFQDPRVEAPFVYGSDGAGNFIDSKGVKRGVDYEECDCDVKGRKIGKLDYLIDSDYRCGSSVNDGTRFEFLRKYDRVYDAGHDELKVHHIEAMTSSMREVVSVNNTYMHYFPMAIKMGYYGVLVNEKDIIRHYWMSLDGEYSKSLAKQYISLKEEKAKRMADSQICVTDADMNCTHLMGMVCHGNLQALHRFHDNDLDIHKGDALLTTGVNPTLLIESNVDSSVMQFPAKGKLAASSTSQEISVESAGQGPQPRGKLIQLDEPMDKLDDSLYALMQSEASSGENDDFFSISRGDLQGQSSPCSTSGNDSFWENAEENAVEGADSSVTLSANDDGALDTEDELFKLDLPSPTSHRSGGLSATASMGFKSNEVRFESFGIIRGSRGRASDCTTVFDYTPHLTDQCQNGTVNILEKLPADGVVRPESTDMKLTEYELDEGDVYIPLGMCAKENAADIPKSERFEAAFKETMKARSSPFPPEEVMKKEKISREMLEELFAFEQNRYDQNSHRRKETAHGDFFMETIDDMLFAAEAVATEYLRKAWDFNTTRAIDTTMAKREAAIVATAHFGKAEGFDKGRISKMFDEVDKRVVFATVDFAEGLACAIAALLLFAPEELPESLDAISSCLTILGAEQIIPPS
eukprot:Seg3589.9 transcript_id=Seg3589.9/GoldUCD/mRNA.D3Y31 product="hypothetical protein" protein_id=Seg3589.9/GoldUCD/D3Y31